MTPLPQLHLDLGPSVAESPRERALRLTGGRGWLWLDEALELQRLHIKERKQAGDWPPKAPTRKARKR